jgi:EpsI family protein
MRKNAAMENLRTRYRIAVALLLGALLANLLLRIGLPEKEAAAVDLREIPGVIGEWRMVEEIELDEEIYRILDPDGLIYRSYQNDSGDVVWLIMQYHLNDRYGAHDPLICHTSQGWKQVLVDDQEMMLVSAPEMSHNANHFVVEKGGMRKLVFFWFFSTDGRETSSRLMMMLYNLKPRLMHRPSISGFVEVSIISSPQADNDARQNLYDFVLNLKHHANKAIRDPGID